MFLACLEDCFVLSATDSMQSPVQNVKKMRKSLRYLAENLGLHHLAQEAGNAPLSGMLLANFLVNLMSESDWIRDAASRPKLPSLPGTGNPDLWIKVESPRDVKNARCTCSCLSSLT